MPHQIAPQGDWRSWVVMGGRGAGKTRAGSEWVRSLVEGPTPLSPGKARRIALVGETMDQAREVMVMGESGLLAVCPPEQMPVWRAGRRILEWPNGAVAQTFSAFNPESLRGPQFDAAWADELAKWPRGRDAWDMLQFSLRLGDDPRACITTTPRRVGVLRELLEMATTVVTHAPTSANRANLAESFLLEVQSRYGGTSLGRQELEGVLLEDINGALWQPGQMAACQRADIPRLTRTVVAVDPPGKSNSNSDECGIVVAGVDMTGDVHEWRAYVLEDATVRAAQPTAWAKAAIDSMKRHDAERLVAEVNMGGEMVEAVVRQVDPLVPFRAVHATRGKSMRAEPIAALYEQGRVYHARGLGELEDQMCQMTLAGYTGKGSPDRLDALVWALQDLMLEPAKKWSRPSIRSL